jgi:ubiquinone biosynthesis protein Coq4
MDLSMYRVVEKLIQWSVPFLNLFRSPPVWPFSFDDLKAMDENSLGFHLYAFLNSRGFNYLPKYEIHDAYHTLLGYGTTSIEELKLQAFMWGNKNSTFAGRVLFIIGLILFPTKYKLFKVEIIRGKKAKALKEYDVIEMIDQPLLQLREELCIR